MGNTVIWKPSPTQQLAASLTMELLAEAGMPPSVINMLPGDGLAVSEVALAHPDLAGIHFTGSTPTFQKLWSTVGQNLPHYRTYPHLVGETGGKDFVIAHPSADPDVLRTALIRRLLRVLRPEVFGRVPAPTCRARCGSGWAPTSRPRPTRCPSATRPTSRTSPAPSSTRAFAKHTEAIARAKATAGPEIIAGGTTDDSVGWFVRPTIVVAEHPADAMFSTEYFGPIFVVHVYDDRQPGAFEAIVKQAESAAPTP